MSGGWELAEGKASRKSRLPDDWQALRKIVIERAGGRCEILMRSGKRCHDPGTDVDHVKAGDLHDLSNLQLLCRWHHGQKTAREANAARTPRTNKHPGEKHPGGFKFY